MKLHLKTSIILILFYCFSYSQDNGLHHRKYWWYKTRLNNDFVKVGLGDGESFPFNQRGANGSGFVNSNTNLKLGDGTSTLGLYIAQLATEYALLKKNAQNTDKVKHELFCALNAFDRVDYKAEDLTQSGIFRLNGFFIRDDIPKNFIKSSKQNYEHFNYYSSWDGIHTINAGDPNTFQSDHGFHSKCDVGMFKVESSWSTRVDDGDYGGLYNESQDQVYDLLLGLAFVNKFVGQGVTDGTNVFPYTGQTDIREQARQQAKRIIDYMRNPQDFNGNDCNASAYDKLVNSWRINNPVTCNQIPTANGGDARPYAYALGEGECAITSNNYSAPATANLIGFPFACVGSGYHNAYSSIAGYTAWQLLAKTDTYNPTNAHDYIDTRVFNTNLSAICNCVYGRVEDGFVAHVVSVLESSSVTNWLGVIINWLYTWIQQTVFQFIPGFYRNVTVSTITTNAYNSGSPLDHGPIAHALLHGFPAYEHNPNYSFDYLLDVAPCDGIYNFGINNQSQFEWSSDNRCDHPDRRGTNAGSGSNATKGEYNGIDFMLYHNLYYLFQSGPSGINVNMTDLSDIYINQPTGLGCSNVNAYETITTENTNITCTSPTAWRAGKTIYFGAGTYITGSGNATSGPNFHAYIQKFDCASDYGVYRMANSDSSNYENSNINDDSYAQGAIYHTVKDSYDNNEVSNLQTEHNASNVEENLITELPSEENPIESLMKASYSNYTKELFIKPTVTIDDVKAYFTMDDDETAFIHVLDLNGKCIYIYENIKASDTGLTIDFTNYATGTYLLKFTTTKGTTKTQKIIKQ